MRTSIPGTHVSSTSGRRLLSIDDLDDDEVDGILQRAGQMAAGEDPMGPPAVVGLLFLTSSLRTRLGFAVAAARIGASAIVVDENRHGPAMSSAESFADTVRVASGMVDVLVARTPEPLAELPRNALRCPIVSGGDGGNSHPTQALIDLFAIERLKGPVGSLSVALCGDLTMRAARSLIELFARRPPAHLLLIAPPERAEHGVALGPVLQARTTAGTWDEIGDVDVLHMVGLPRDGSGEPLDADSRIRYALDEYRLRLLPSRAVVTSPLPLIDELTDQVRGDARLRMWQQSDLGVWVRMAVLEWALRGP